MAKRRNFTDQFKAKVADDAYWVGLKEQKAA